MSTYRELIQTAREILKKQEISDAEVDAWYLLAHVFQMSRMELLINGEKSAPDAKSSQYLMLAEKRAEHIPLQQLIGTQEFMGLEFEVNEDVLIPRQDTEVLVEEVLKVCEGKTVLDMCTGSGCIIISLAKLGKLCGAAGADISEKALSVAASNAARHGTGVEFCQSDLFASVEGVYDIIVSNPPYIPTEEIDRLMPEVKDHEPRLALDGSSDGLEFYRRIASEAKNHLRAEGYLFMEIGYNQAKAVKELLVQEGYTKVIVKQDLSGLDRVVAARLRTAL